MLAVAADIRVASGSAFDRDDLVDEWMRHIGDGVAGYFANVKRDEFFAYHSAVSPWEIDQYLTAF